MTAKLLASPNAASRFRLIFSTKGPFSQHFKPLEFQATITVTEEAMKISTHHLIVQ